MEDYDQEQGDYTQEISSHSDAPLPAVSDAETPSLSPSDVTAYKGMRTEPPFLFTDGEKLSY
jgi:hypothetical protein